MSDLVLLSRVSIATSRRVAVISRMPGLGQIRGPPLGSGAPFVVEKGTAGRLAGRTVVVLAVVRICVFLRLAVLDYDVHNDQAENEEHRDSEKASQHDCPCAEGTRDSRSILNQVLLAGSVGSDLVANLAAADLILVAVPPAAGIPALAVRADHVVERGGRTAEIAHLSQHPVDALDVQRHLQLSVQLFSCQSKRLRIAVHSGNEVSDINHERVDQSEMVEEQKG